MRNSPPDRLGVRSRAAESAKGVFIASGLLGGAYRRGV